MQEVGILNNLDWRITYLFMVINNKVNVAKY